MLNTLSANEFETLIGQEIAVASGGGPLRVDRVKTFSEHELRASAPFSVILSGPMEGAFGQGIQMLTHPNHGPLELFMVPIGPSEGRMRYEVIFN